MTVQSSDCEKKFKADTLENEDCLTKSFKQEQIGYELYNVVLDDVGLHMPGQADSVVVGVYSKQC